MNLLDVIILVSAAAAGYAGYRFGFTGRALSWLGLTLGVVVGVLFVDDIANALQDSTPRTRLVGSLAFLFLVTIIGQTLGMAAGAVLRQRLHRRAILSATDRGFGAAVGVLSVLVGVWLLTPAFASSPGWPARTARGSMVVRAVDRIAPPAPHSIEALGRLVGDAPFPQVFDRLTSPGEVGEPPASSLPAEVSQRVRGSVVKIEGRACDLIQQGTGWVIDANVVVTNAHVVAGHESTTVLGPDGRQVEARLVLFDSARDIAVLRTSGLELASLERGDGEVGTNGAVFGYPGGGPEQESPARIAEEILARGTNIYRNAATTREVYELAAELEPGDSGGPLVDRRGRVVGMAFAVDPGSSTTAYALTHDELEAGLGALDSDGRTLDSGPCLVG